MSKKAKVSATTSDSILLFFKDGDEIIARNWQKTEKQMITMSHKPV